VHLGAEALRNLHGIGANATRRAVNQHLLTGFELPGIAQGLQCRDGRDGNRRRLLETDVGRLTGDGPVLGHLYVLGKRPGPAAEDLVTRLEPRDAGADGFDRAGEVDTEARIVRRPQSRHQAHDVGGAPHVMPVEGVDGRGLDLHQDFVVRRLRLRQIDEFDNLRRAVTSVDDCFHRIGSRGRRHRRRTFGLVAQYDNQRRRHQCENRNEADQDLVTQFHGLAPLKLVASLHGFSPLVRAA
jgi:hypothetical protein